jgi:hypothetical protein
VNRQLVRKTVPSFSLWILSALSAVTALLLYSTSQTMGFLSELDGAPRQLYSAFIYIFSGTASISFLPAFTRPKPSSAVAITLLYSVALLAFLR